MPINNMMSLKLELIFDPDNHLDFKWLKTDLEEALKKNQVPRYWNDLLSDGELFVINGPVLSGSSTPTESSSSPGFVDSVNVKCSKESANRDDPANNKKSNSVIPLWTWKDNIDAEVLSNCISILQKEQRNYCYAISGNTVSSCRLQQRLIVAYRYFKAFHKCLLKHVVTAPKNNVNTERVSSPNTDVSEDDKSVESFNKNVNNIQPSSTNTQPALGFIEIGTKTALNFAFSFLKRAWRSGDDCDLCTDLLQESYNALQTLRPLILFDESELCGMWTDVLEKCVIFLKQVVLGEVNNNIGQEIPFVDKHYALKILLEIAMQRGTITAVLDMALLLLMLSKKNDSLQNSRFNEDDYNPPLVPFLKRFRHALRTIQLNDDKSNMWTSKRNYGDGINPTECFLKFLDLPDDNNAPVDCKIAAVIIMCYLNRMIRPYLPTAKYLENEKKMNQTIYRWGWFTHDKRRKLLVSDIEGRFVIRKLLFSNKFCFFITAERKLYSYHFLYEVEPLVAERINYFDDKDIEDIAAHPEGSHYMALTSDGLVYTWGLGVGGRLGHGDSEAKDEPKLVEKLLGFKIVRIACGSSYSAAITSEGKLFTWGSGNYGRLGHGTNEDFSVPTFVEALKDMKVVDVACGCGDSQTLAVVENGQVYSWGDGDYGKLGNGGKKSSSKLPELVGSLTDVFVTNVYCGEQFSVALTREGNVYTWGKGDNYRLGTGGEEHVRYPTKLNAFKGIKVKKLAIGLSHCLALLENGDLYGWGKREYCLPAESQATGVTPELIDLRNSYPIDGIFCGSTDCYAWTCVSSTKVSCRSPFVTDVCKEAMYKLNELLTISCEGVITTSDWPPTQEQECIIVAALNVLQLQLYAISTNQVDVSTLDLHVTSNLLSNIKQIVIDLASTNGVLETIQLVAQSVLQTCWTVLLPTADERAKTLCSLITTSDWNNGCMNKGQHFMMDLLVTCLMADNGLEKSLLSTIKAEISEIPNDHISGHGVSTSYPIPLLQLTKHLLRNCSAETQVQLIQLRMPPGTNERSPTLMLLLRFQRLLVGQMYNKDFSRCHYLWESEKINSEVESLFHKYLVQLMECGTEVLNVAAELSLKSTKHFCIVTNILKYNGIEVLLSETFVCFLMLHQEMPLLLDIDWVDLFLPLFNALEKFNRTIPYLEKEDADDMSWPGVTVSGFSSACKKPTNAPLIRKADVENHNRDGGLWVVYKGKVYDVQDGSDHAAINGEQGSSLPMELLQSCYIGSIIDSDEEGSQLGDVNPVYSGLLDVQRTVVQLLSYHARWLANGVALQPSEQAASKYLSASFLMGGLSLNPLKDKTEARNVVSPFTDQSMIKPGVKLIADFTTDENDLTGAINEFEIYLEHIYKQQNAYLSCFERDHPVEELTRILLATIIKHLALGSTVFAAIKGEEPKYKQHVELVARELYKTRLKIIQLKQEQNQSYKEICGPMIEKCRFLMFEVRPATSSEIYGFYRARLMYTENRLKKAVHRVISDIKCNRSKSSPDVNIPKYYGLDSEDQGSENYRNEEYLQHLYFNIKPGSTDMISSIIQFVVDDQTVNIETIRKAMYYQAQRCDIQKKGYDLFLKVLHLPTVITSIKHYMISGWMSDSSLLSTRKCVDVNKNLLVRPSQKIEVLLAKAKVLQWTINKLHDMLLPADGLFSLTAMKDQCYSPQKLIWIRLVLLRIGLLTEVNNAGEVNLLVNSGIFAFTEFILRRSELSHEVKHFGLHYNDDTISAIIEPNLHASVSGYPPFYIPKFLPYIRVGSRVVRGRDWKWGNQDGLCHNEGTIVHLSGDGWAHVRWDAGTRNTYRMGKDGKYDLKLAPSRKSEFKYFDFSDEDVRDKDNEKLDFVKPMDAFRTVSVTFLKTLLICAGIHGDLLQQSSVRNISSFLRYILQKYARIKQQTNVTELDVNVHHEEWATLSFIRAISCSKSFCRALCSPSCLELLLSILSGDNLNYIAPLSVQWQVVRLLSSILPNGLSDPKEITTTLERFFYLLGDIALRCYPNIPFLYNGDNKSVVLMTASPASTIIEECIQLMCKLHSFVDWTEPINSLITSNLTIATDMLIHPVLLSITDDTDNSFHKVDSVSIAALLILGSSFDHRIRLGGIAKGNSTFKTGIVCSISNSCSAVTLQVEDKYSTFSLDSLTPVAGLTFQLDKIPTTDMFLDTLATLISASSLTHSFKIEGITIDVPLLRHQQQILAAVKCGRLLLKYQSRLRKVMKRPTLETHMSLEALNEVDSIGNGTQSILLHQLIVNAVQPSTLKSSYSRQELEEAVINVSQFLATEVESSTRNLNHGNVSKNDKTNINFNNEADVDDYDNDDDNDLSDPKCCKKYAIPSFMMPLLEMGFSKCSIDLAIKDILSKGLTPNVENMIQWILEHPESSEDCNSINFQEKNSAHLVRYIQAQLANSSNTHSATKVSDAIKVGDTVKVKSDVAVPRFRWGSITHNSVGIVTGITSCREQVIVNYPEQHKWVGQMSEVEVLPPHHQNVRCDGCSTVPIVGARFKCKLCENFNLCENCFFAPEEHSHNFVRIVEPSSAVIFAGKPRKMEKYGACVVSDSDLIEDNASCIRRIFTSSRENWAHHLLDVYSESYWQSSGTQGKHWIRLEIFPDILIYSLRMKVDPADDTYMPSLVKVKVGPTFRNMEEVAVHNIYPSDSLITLLTDMCEYYSCVEIDITMCRSLGIDCKVHAIHMIGKKKDTIHLSSSAPFLALDYNDIQDSSGGYLNEQQSTVNDRLENKVFVWGLNDKEQLGGIKGSKMKFPAFSESLSTLKPIHIAGGSKTLFIVSYTGKVYACGDNINGRLGLGNTNSLSSSPRRITSLNQYSVKKVAVHSGGKHAMALTFSGKVFSWGEGDDGKLGHGNAHFLSKPKIIEYFKSKRISEIACGSSYSAAVTSCGELYTWGLGEYGRLGHGDNMTQYKPKLVRALLGNHVIQVACGSRDAQTLALDNKGMVYSWGDGDFGKLGRGTSEECKVPCNIEFLNDKDVIRIECGAQFSLALTKSGQVYTWGKGDYYRLGHGSNNHVRVPTLVSTLSKVHIIDVAVGALHCLAVSSLGVVYSWGDNDHGQQGNGTSIENRIPTKVDDFGDVKVNRVACGSSHSVAYQAYKPPTYASTEPVAFSSNNDPLGSSTLGIEEATTEEFKPDANIPEKPSLSKQILNLDSNLAKQTALQHMLNALRISFARDAVISALSSSSATKMEKIITAENKYSNPVINSPKKITLESSISPIADGGGEAPAPAFESADDLSLSSHISPDDENPLLNFSSTTSSGSTSYHHTLSRISASTVSVIAATFKSTSQIIGTTEQEILSKSSIREFVDLLGLNDARILVDLLKLAVAERCADNGEVTLSNILKALAASHVSVASMLFELCVTELEHVAINNDMMFQPYPVVQESSHPYTYQGISSGIVRIPGVEALRVEFDKKCSTEKNRDVLLLYSDGIVVHTVSGRDYSDWSSPVIIRDDELRWKFNKDVKNTGWGWRFTVYPIIGKERLGSDRDVLSRPSIDVVINLLDSCICCSSNADLIIRLASALASCAQLSSLDGKKRMWCLNKLCEFVKPPWKSVINLSSFAKLDNNDSSLSNLLKALPNLLMKQYEYEEQFVKRGKQLMYSPFFKAAAALACELEVDALPSCADGKWSWFRNYCFARRVATAFINRTPLPASFCTEVRKILGWDKLSNTEKTTEYEDNELFTAEHDEQLLLWLNRKPETWAISWTGSGIIYAWGHNHRGQLGGVAGNQVKIPTHCEALTALKPVQLASGEQTLFCVTAEGRVYATGYADKGRLGIGSLSDWNLQNPFVSTPCLIDSLCRVFVIKVAVHSGGKHCLALTSNEEVYAWGDGEDGKLGLGHKSTIDRPCLVESLRGKNVVDISCGGSHSAAITKDGKLFTWGRGRYGRLGHGTCDDLLYPKLVETLLPYHVCDVACGSGDAQTLCITADDNVWSWGDGDYGKLGRGGSDGCTVPLKIESLAGLGVRKVECGSQFSVALTRSGSVYTWGKGDYFRLGHGTDEHVRRPRKVSALQGKKIVDISTGSLHVVVRTDKGEVYAWGDNDEGQLGDGSLFAIPKPRLISALQDKSITQVVCGSAHTFAKSSDKPVSKGSNLPQEIPLEYDMLRYIPIPALRNRIVMMHYFSDLIDPIVPMLPLEGDISLDKLRGILIYTAKESIFRKAVNSTMAREPNHGPTIELNRIQIKRFRTKGTKLAGPCGTKSVFGQMVNKLSLLKNSLLLPQRVWKVQFVGESVDDYGGGYSESITEMCEELQNGSVPILIATPNGREETGTNRDCFILNPSATSPLYMNMLHFLGVLLGIAIRTGSPLGLTLAEPVWNQLAGIPLTLADLTEIDKHYIPGLIYIRDMPSNESGLSDIPFTTTSASGMEVPLSSCYDRVTFTNRQEYIRLALNYRLHEFDEQVAAVRAGMARVVPVPLLSLFSGYELETMVCGSPDIPLDLLKSVTVYKGILSIDPLVQWFWEIMEEFTSQERSLFLRFVWGRTRLPRTCADFRGKDFILHAMDKYNPPDSFLPESYTCFFMLKMPKYTSKTILREKLKYAIYFCKSIDTDDYARIAIPGPGMMSSISDSDEIEIVSDDDLTPTL